MKKLIVMASLFVLMSGPWSAYADYLVYQSGGSQDHIVDAMTSLGFSFDVRNAANPVTAADLASYEALIIGWSAGGFNMSGLDAAILESGITGNRILTGHDADYHTWAGNAAAATFMERAVLFAGAANTAGILAFPIFSTNPFPYLPVSWGISSFDNLVSESIDEITAAGISSGLYNGITEADMSNWGNSFHAGFTAWDPSFEVFEIGSPPESTAVTIGTTVEPLPEPSATLLLGIGLIGLVGLGRRVRRQTTQS